MEKEIRNSFEQEMVDSGYKIFKPNHKNAIRGFQKRFDDAHGKKYFITIWHYNHREQLGNDVIPEGDSYTSDTQFRFNDNQTCNIEFWGDIFPNEWREVTTLKDIEDFFEKCWIMLKPDYYEKWDE